MSVRSRAGEASWAGGCLSPCLPWQAKQYVQGLPECERKDFASVVTNASPLGRAGGSGAVSGAWGAGPPPLA